jgi:hypothetical protein
MMCNRKEHHVEKIAGNVTLAALSNGRHHLTVYATDTIGNKGEASINFEVATFPLITVVGLVAIGVIISSSGFIIFIRSQEKKRCITT